MSTHEINVDRYNYTAIQVLEYLDNKDPSQDQINFIERMLKRIYNDPKDVKKILADVTKQSKRRERNIALGLG